MSTELAMAKSDYAGRGIFDFQLHPPGKTARTKRGFKDATTDTGSPEDAAVILGISDRTLENYRVRDGGGPPFTRVGRLVRYKVADLRAWMEAGYVD